MGTPTVISTLNAEGVEVMGPDVVAYHYPTTAIVSGSLLTVESNHFCVVKSRGAILKVYEMGQYPLVTGDRPILGSLSQMMLNGQSAWQYEAVYINRAKLVVKASGIALSAEMAEMRYDVDYYIHVPTEEGVLKLIQHMPYSGHFLKTKAVNEYAGPVVEQAINQVVQVTPLERVNEKIHEITEMVKTHLGEFLDGYGIALDNVKVLVRPNDDRMRTLISLKAFGLSELEAVRYYIALQMAERGVVSAPNMANGTSFNIGASRPSVPLESSVSGLEVVEPT